MQSRRHNQKKMKKRGRDHQTGCLSISPTALDCRLAATGLLSDQCVPALQGMRRKSCQADVHVMKQMPYAVAQPPTQHT